MTDLDPAAIKVAVALAAYSKAELIAMIAQLELSRRSLTAALVETQEREQRVRTLQAKYHDTASEATSERITWRSAARELRAALDGNPYSIGPGHA
jgi:hypothetical protein